MAMWLTGKGGLAVMANAIANGKQTSDNDGKGTSASAARSFGEHP